MKLVPDLVTEKDNLYNTFLSVTPSLETALQKLNLKLTVKSINRKSNLPLSFFYHISPHLVACIKSICTSALLFYFSNLHNATRVAHNFKTMLISTNIRKSNANGSQIKALKKL